jgi:hypothetical protein
MADDNQAGGTLSSAPLFYPAGHYYSPIPDLQQVLAQVGRLWPDPLPRELPGIALDEAGQLATLARIARYAGEQPWEDAPQDGLRYNFVNDFYSYADALYLYGMLRDLRPAHLIEVGSGYSSAVTLDTNERFLGGSAHCTFIEPEPGRLYTLLHDQDRERVQIIARPVQEVPVARFLELGADDVLFIDGSHVAKIGSDVCYLVGEVLPQLRPGVIVHFHDIFWPFEYPLDWTVYAWNECYMVRAFLSFNVAYQIILFGDYLATWHRARLAELLPLALRNTGGSLWLRRQ